MKPSVALKSYVAFGSSYRWMRSSLMENSQRGWLGPRPTGLLVYDRSGYLAVQIMHGPRERTVPDQARASRPEYYAYFGTFEVDERAHTIVHRVQGSLFPDEAGVSYRQDFTVSRDHLILVTALHLVDGEERRNRIEWQSVEERAARESPLS
jgi:hypothetical protein